MLPADHPLLAIVSPPRAPRFFERTGVDPEEGIRGDFGGWCKLALLTRDRVFLFPRTPALAEAMEREIAALEVFAVAGLDEIPALLGVFRDDDLGNAPMIALRRLPGVTLDSVLPGVGGDVLASLSARLGTLAARWHAVDPGPLVRRSPRSMERLGGLKTLLGGECSIAEATALVARCLSLDPLGHDAVRNAIERARQLAPVPIHGDLHEAQLLVDPSACFALTGVIDWQTACVDHPFCEFDFGEWGPTVWRAHRAAMPALRARFWDAYAPARGLAPDLGPVFEWVYATSLALQLEAGRQPAFDASVVGSLEAARAAARQATAAL